MNTNYILYFSLNPASEFAFLSYVERNRFNYKDSFRVINNDDGRRTQFKHASDLIFFLDSLSHELDFDQLYVIIDYFSLCREQTSLRYDSAWRAADIIRRAILKYPEVLFLFDEIACEEIEFQWQKFLFRTTKRRNSFIDSVTSSIIREYHSFHPKKDKDPFLAITRERSNLFDGSGLRYAIKVYMYEELNANKHNFSLYQDSRNDNLAICVEEEHSQNRFNSYALYSNGYRVLPVTSAQELWSVNNNCEVATKGDGASSALLPDSVTIKLIVRDYDLQFQDAPKNAKISIPEVGYVFNAVDYIRGLKFFSDKLESRQNIDKIPSNYNGCVFSLYKEKRQGGDEYDYWSHLCGKRTIFITKGTEYFKPGIGAKYKDIDFSKDDGEKCVFAKGLCKPVSGVILPLQGIECIEERYKSFEVTGHIQTVKNRINKVLSDIIVCQDEEKRKALVCYILSILKEDLFKDDGYDDEDNGTVVASIERLCSFPPLERSFKASVMNVLRQINGIDSVNSDFIRKLENRENDNELSVWYSNLKKTQGWYIDTSRENHAHGVPLAVYDLVKAMISRAKAYYRDGKYIRSAVIAIDAIEVLNGFHEALMLDAYHVLAISENAIAMNTIGGSEKMLRNDAFFRINKIKSEINRLIARKDDDDRGGFKDNVLNQIFSDCRNFCKEREHFKAEEAFISAMGHANDGINIWAIIPTFIRKISSR